MGAPTDAARARLEGVCRQAARGHCLTRFLNAEEGDLLQGMARARGLTATLWGGYPQAERKRASVSAEDDAADDAESLIPSVTCVRLSWDARADAPGHRDLLGAALGLGLEREVLGDIVLSGSCAYLFCTSVIAPVIARELVAAGTTALRAELSSAPETLGASGGIPVRLTAASLRLDGVLASLNHMSRANAAALITRGGAQVNHAPEARPDRRLKPGDIITVRGQGRFRLEEARENRKGRQVLTCAAFGDFPAVQNAAGSGD